MLIKDGSNRGQGKGTVKDGEESETQTGQKLKTVGLSEQTTISMQ